MKVDKSTWKKATLGDVCRIINGDRGKNYPAKTKLSDKGKYPFISASNLNNHSVSKDELLYLSEMQYNLLSNGKIEKGDIALCIRGSLGKFGYFSFEKGAIASSLVILRPLSTLDRRFLGHYLSSNLFFNQIALFQNGVAQPNLSANKLSEFQILLPPEKEQVAIVDEMDRIQGMIDGYKAQIADLDALAQSIFLDTFGDPITNPKGWPIKALGDVCFKITDGTHASPKFTSEGIPFIFVSNVVNYEITYDVQKHIDEETYSELWKSTPVEPGDIIYTSVGSYGNPAIVRDERKFMFQRHIALLKIDHTILHSEFVKWFLISPAGKNQADEKAIGVAQKTLNLKAIKSFELPLPPLALQELFAARVKAIEELKVKLREQVADCEMLMAERMQAYFS